MKRVVILLVLLACKKPAPQREAVLGDGGQNADGGFVATEDGHDEATVRAGKRTGLATPDEKPEVATEPLARGLIRGEVPWDKVIDRTVGVVELRSYPASETLPAQSEVAHRCGTDLERALGDLSLRATDVLDAPGLVYDIVCDNLGLTVAIAGVTSHAVCSIASPSGDGLELDLVFVPDPKLGLRLIGVSTADALTTEDALRDDFDEHLGRFGARCP